MTDEHDYDDEELERLMKPLSDDAALPDLPAIEGAIKTAGAVYENSRAVKLVQSNDATARVRAHDDSQPKTRRLQKAAPMFTFAKPLVVLAASIMLLIVAFVLPNENALGDLTLGKVLDQAMQADTLQLTAVRDGQESDVWIQAGQRLRWEDSEKKYRIASGTRLWQIDETTQSVVQGSNPWLREGREEIDLLAVLGLNAGAATKFRAAKPIGRIEHAGTLCDVFETEADLDGRRVIIRAFADVKTQDLYSIAAWPDARSVRTAAPLAELRLVNRNVPYDEEKFAVDGALSEDGRIGKITDSQGIVLLRPMTVSRWTPVCGPILIKPGDWLRTDVRGANAVETELISDFNVTLGPGSLLEIVSAGELKLHRGEVQMAGGNGAKTPLKLLARNDDPVLVAAGETKHLRLDRDESFVVVEQKPLWLQGFEGTTSNESIGSLVANIDGRDVPLTVGFHKVKVEIRDQIARTTIEESFVNRTPGRLEGVFHFPLPQDASISGFGMWINGELIEADVVEKQRAREIYETILREKRDPGLLEWTGGNIFKARVFPIEPHSEKRIKIVYTQVLPLRANKYRYSYGLRSEMLQKTPLRELSLEVLVNSALPLKSVDCPTHPVRVQQTEHSARVEFNEQEYSPTRDFEVVCEIDSRQSDVVVIPHRRGDDGYFLAQVTPPSAEGDWQRDVLPDGQPLNLLLVCDTSGSMDSRNRELQEQFIASVLSTLSPADRFNIATCDVDTQWKFEEAVLPTEAQTEVARAWLSERRSLGWTDLDKMAESVMERVTKSSLLPRPGGEGAQRADEGADDGVDHTQQAHVIYIGDGIVTARDADPQAFVTRLKRMTEALDKGTFHAVSVGSRFESTVLKSIAAVGGGSVRQIDGEQTPQRTANELLNEIAQPGLRNMSVEFRGLQVAAVYPEMLPNLSAGTQQIIIGRYLPQGDDQTGEIIVTGERNGEPVRYASRITLNDAETGNSFIPRLWARAHLDSLLQQGGSEFIKDEIIALSEEFHIMTPYTSLLVLETDEDRERFGVKRRYLMRDGERFFADGSSSARFELLQEQMKAAGDWRLGMRRRILAELSRLGRDSKLFQEVVPRLMEQAAQHMPMSGSRGLYTDFGRTSGWAGSGPYSGPYGGAGFGGGFDDGVMSIGGTITSLGDSTIDEMMEMGGDDLSKKARELAPQDEELDFDMAGRKDLSGFVDRQLMDFDANMPGASQPVGDFRMNQPMRESSRLRQRQSADKISFLSSELESLQAVRLERSASSFEGKALGFYGRGYAPYVNPYQYTQWVNQLFPTIPPEPAEPTVPDTTWSDEAIAISQSLVQPLMLESGGLRFVFDHEGFDPRWDRQTSQSQQTRLYSAKRWLTLSESVGSQTIVNWCDGDVRAAWSRAFDLGQSRTAGERDLSSFDDAARAYARSPLHHSFPKHSVEIQRPGDDRIVLVLTPDNPDTDQQFTVTIDSARQVVLEAEWQQDGKVTSTTTYSDYVELAGCWWPQSMDRFDGDGQVTSTTRLTLTLLNDDDFATQYVELTPDADTSVLLSLPAPSVQDAKVAVAGGQDTLEHHLVLLLNESLVQNWDEVARSLSSMERIADGKSGINWIRLAVLQAMRKNEDALQLGRQLLDSIVREMSADELFLVNHCIGQLDPLIDRNELLSLLDALQPLIDRQPEIADAERTVKHQRALALTSLQRLPEALVLQRELAEEAAWDVWAQMNYAQALAAAGNFDEAQTWLGQRLQNDTYNESERTSLRDTYARLLRQQNAADLLVTFLAEWVAENPTSQTAYDQYLAALFLANRLEDADNQAKEWIAAAKRDEKLDPAALARLNAAVTYGLGDRYQLYMYWIDPAWLKPLEETAQYFFRHEHHFDVAVRIMNHHRFHITDERDRLVALVAEQLKASVAELDVSVISSFVSWAIPSSDLNREEWLQIASVVRTRRDAETELADRDSLAASLIRIYSVHSRDELHLPFLRDQIARAEATDPPDEHRVAGFVNQLFNELLGRDWSQKFEEESLLLLPRVSAAESKAVQLVAQVSALHRFVDRMLEARFQSDVKILIAEGKPEDLTRTELAEKYAEFRSAAREGVANRLSDAMSNPDHADEEPDNAPAGQPAVSLNDWLLAERMHLDVQLNRNLPDVIESCWKILGEVPVAESDDDDEDVDTETLRFAQISRILQQRVLVLVSNLAVRRSAPEGLAQQVLDYIDAGIANGGDAAAAWKSRRLAMLVALDQPEQIERNLRQWIQDDEYSAPWQLMLGRIVAEQGKIDEAIRLFESVKRDEKSLPPSDYAALSKWYLVADRREDYEEARINIFMLTEEWQISNWLNQQRRPWYRTDVPLPTELDENVLFAFQALFRKSNTPGQYVYQLRDFYTACRDFRLLQMIPDSVVGRTQQQIYSFLGALQSNLLQELRNEATANEIMTRLVEVRESAETAIDKRACDLLEAMIERRSSQVLNQPGPHVDAAVAALKRAFERDWADGEVQQMSAFLDGMGTIRQAALADERLRQLRALHRMTEAGTDERLLTAWHLSHALFHSHNRRDEGIATMEIAVREFEATNPNGWPVRMNTQLDGYLSFLEAERQYARAERVVLEQLEKPENNPQELWLRQQRNEVLLGAFRNKGLVSIGEGDELYQNLWQHLLVEAENTDDNYQSQVMSGLIQFFRQAKEHGIGGHLKDLRIYAFEQFPELLRPQSNQYQNLISNLQHTVHDLLGPKEGLAFLIARIEVYPARLEYTYQSSWQQFGYQLAQYRHEASQQGELGDLEDRLLAIALKELRRDLLTGQQRNRSMFHHDNGHFWSEKAGDFLRVAEEVLKEREDSGRAVAYIANFLYYDLEVQNRAIEVMLIAHGKGLLDRNSTVVVCNWLHLISRHAESIPLLEPLVSEFPDTMQYRTMLITAYGHSDRKQQMHEQLAATDEHFRRPGLWTETHMADLAACCYHNYLYERCVDYYDEAISLNQRTQPNRGIGTGTLSGYYSEQGRAYSRLGRTIEAVDAAAAGVIAWGLDYSQRSSSVSELRTVIREAKDLDAFVFHLDQQVEESGTDSPLIRKIVGEVYESRKQYRQAVTQLQLSLELQPNDTEAQQSLIKAYEELGDEQSVVDQMLAMLDFDRHNLELYSRLAEKLKDDESEAERAATTIVEAAPSEAEHHQKLAEFREAQNRWADAIPHWHHVAELRSLEPTGLINLAEAQLHEEQWDQARETLRKLRMTDWPSRFGDVNGQVRNLESQLPE